MFVSADKFFKLQEKINELESRIVNIEKNHGSLIMTLKKELDSLKRKETKYFG